MSGSVNKVILLGRLGQDPELKTTTNDNTVAKFSLATDEQWKDKNGEKQQKTTWHTVIAWGKLAEIIEKYLVKGSQVYIEGKIQVRSYEKDDEKKYVTEIIANNLVMLGGGSKNEDGGEAEGKPAGKKAEAKKSDSRPKGKPIEDEDDVPF